MAKMRKDELLSIIRAHRKDALGGDNGELTTERSESLDRYFGRPYGNEMEGRSAVVSKDLADTVDWIMPSLMRVFTASDKYVQFDPVGPEDEQQAEQESDYVNHVIMKENPGWLLFHDWFKDALLLKNGYIKHWADETEEATYETYSGLTEDELVPLLQELEASGDKIEIVGQDVTEQGYTLKIRTTRKTKKIRLEVVPPEEIRVSRRARGAIRLAPFVEHITKKTRSELIEMGLKKDFVDGLPAYVDDDENTERLARDTVSDHSDEDGQGQDHSMDEVGYAEAYLKVDYDGDGIAELRKVVTVGNQIPDGPEWNEEIDAIPFSDITPNRMPHRHIGRSIQDEIEDLAEIKTALLRAMLDNTYGLVNHEYVVNKRVVLEDFLTSRPFGIKRVNDDMPVEGSVMPVMKASVVDKVLPVLDYVDNVKEIRTGVGKNTLGLDPNTLSDATKGAYMSALQQANQKVEMIARLFAETGVKDAAHAVHSLCIKHQDKQKVVKLRNQWTTINPREWKNRTDLTVSVGLGTGSKDEIKQNLVLMGDLQERASQAGIVTPRNVYNLAEKISDALGFKQEGLFFSDPDSDEVKQMQQGQQQTNPLVEAEQIKAQVKMQADQMSAEFKRMHEMHRLQFETYKFQQEHALAIAKAEIEALAKMVKGADLGRPGIGAETHNPTATPQGM